MINFRPPVTQPACPSGGSPPDCCANGGRGKFCCTNGANNQFCCTNGANNQECAQQNEYLPPVVVTQAPYR